METITFTTTRGTISLGLTGDYILQRATGIGGLGAEMQMQKAPFQQGTTFIRNDFTNRNIVLTIWIKATGLADLNAKKLEVQNVFNPHRQGTLTYSNETYTKDITAVSEISPRFTAPEKKDFYYNQQCVVSLIANNPFWLDQTYTSELMSITLPTFSFPLKFQDTIEFSTDGNIRATLTNSGHVETPVLLDFYGPATNPKIDLEYTDEDTGETITKYIEVTETIAADEYLEISTEFGNVYVKLVDSSGNESSAFSSINRNSDFFQLPVGDSEISFSTASGTSTATLLAQYKNRFIGL